MRRQLRTVAAGTVIASVAAVSGHSSPDSWAQLVARLTGPERHVVTGRLAALEAVLPSGAAVAAAHRRGPSVRSLAAETLASATGEHRRAVAHLLMGHTAEAEVRLLGLVASDSTGTVWNDLAVVLLHRSESDETSIFRALGAVERAIDLAPSAAAPRFNRAVILDRLGLRSHAAEAFRLSLRFDGSSEWAVEARQRLRELEIELDRQREQDWESLVPTLLRSAAEGNSELAVAAARTFPQESRTWAEGVFLADWGAAVLRGTAAAADANLALARAIGDEIHAQKGEGLLREAVRVIDSAASDTIRTSDLAAAHVAYRDARQLYAERRISAAATRLDDARRALERGESPMALMAAYFRANASIDAGNRTQALASLVEMGSAPAEYKALHAQIAWSRATIAVADGTAGEALESFERAAAIFVALGEVPNVLEIRSRLATTLTVLGRPADAWRIHRAVFSDTERLGNARGKQLVIWSAAWDAVSEQNWDIAHALLSLAAQVEDGNPVVTAEAAVWRPMAAERAGIRRRIASELAAARDAVRNIPDPLFRDAESNVLRFVEGVLLSAEHPEAALHQFSACITEAVRLRRTQSLPDVLMARASVLRRLGRNDEARTDLALAIDIIETRTAAVTRDVIRDSFFGKSADAYTLLAEVLDHIGDAEAAVAALDQRRARLLLERSRVDEDDFSFGHVVAALRPDTALITYGLFRDRIAIYAVHPRGFERRQLPISIDVLERLATQFTASIERDDEVRARAIGKRLHDLLIAPVRTLLTGVDTLVLVADAPLDRVPFAAFVQPDGRYLVEDFSLTSAPGIRAFASASSWFPTSSPSVVVIGNPTFDMLRYSDLPRLPAAGQEARSIHAMHRQAKILIENDASEKRALAAIRQATIVHFATHAMVDLDDGSRSRLLLASHDDLTAAEIADMKLDDVETVILAGCRTAVVAKGYGFVRSLANAFLAAGARNVVASLWNVDDEAARYFSIALHEALRDEVEPTAAVRRAQLSMLHSSDRALRKAAAWSSMHSYGFGHR